MTPRLPVPIQIAGSTYRVHSSASGEELSGLAAVVEQKLRELMPGAGPVPPQAFLLVAMGLAHDLREERVRRLEAERALVQEQARRPVPPSDRSPESPLEGAPRARPAASGKRR